MPRAIKRGDKKAVPPPPTRKKVNTGLPLPEEKRAALAECFTAGSSLRAAADHCEVSLKSAERYFSEWKKANKTALTPEERRQYFQDRLFLMLDRMVEMNTAQAEFVSNQDNIKLKTLSEINELSHGIYERTTRIIQVLGSLGAEPETIEAEVVPELPQRDGS